MEGITRKETRFDSSPWFDAWKDIEKMTFQFEIFLDPLGDWCVWDSDANDFAILGSHQAYGLSREDATIASELLNRIALRRERDGRSVSAAKR